MQLIVPGEVALALRAPRRWVLLLPRAHLHRAGCDYALEVLGPVSPHINHQLKSPYESSMHSQSDYLAAPRIGPRGRRPCPCRLTIAMTVVWRPERWSTAFLYYWRDNTGKSFIIIIIIIRPADFLTSLKIGSSRNDWCWVISMVVASTLFASIDILLLFNQFLPRYICWLRNFGFFKNIIVRKFERKTQNLTFW